MAVVQEKPSHPLEKEEVSPEDLNSWFRCVAIDQARLVLGVGLISMESLLLGPVMFIEHTSHMFEKIIDLVIPPTSFSPTVSLLGCYICITLGCPTRMQSLMDRHQKYAPRRTSSLSSPSTVQTFTNQLSKT